MYRRVLAFAACATVLVGLLGCSEPESKKDLGTRTYLPDSFRRPPERRPAKRKDLIESKSSSTQFKSLESSSSRPGFFDWLFGSEKKAPVTSVPSSPTTKPGGLPLPQKATGQPPEK